MDDKAFDTALVAAAFTQAGLTGWRTLSVVDAALSAGLPLDQARARFPGPGAVLTKFGLLADQAALASPPTELRARDRLFDLLMRRFDVLQAHRDGMTSLLQVLPTDPALAIILAGATLRSMGWMLEAAGIPATGVRGLVRAQGLVGVWLYALRAWRDDSSPDLAGTMAAMDKALDQAERYSAMFGLDVDAPAKSATEAEAEAMAMDGVIDVPGEPEPLPPMVMPPPPPFDVPPPSPV